MVHTECRSNCECWGHCFIEVDRDCLNFNIMDMLKIMIHKAKPIRGSEFLVVNDGVRDNFLMVVHVMIERDLNWGYREKVVRRERERRY